MKKELTLEQAMDRLDEIVVQLDGGKLALEQSLKLFEEGTRLAALCDKKMRDARQKIEIISREIQKEQETEE